MLSEIEVVLSWLCNIPPSGEYYYFELVEWLNQAVELRRRIQHNAQIDNPFSIS